MGAATFELMHDAMSVGVEHTRPNAMQEWGFSNLHADEVSLALAPMQHTPMRCREQRNMIAAPRIRMLERLDRLEQDLQGGLHLGDPDSRMAMNENLLRLQVYRRIMSEEEIDFLNAARIAIGDELEWK